MKAKITGAAAIVSLMLFSCSDDTSSVEDFSSSSGKASSNSSNTVNGACIVPGSSFGLSEELFGCEEYLEGMADMQKRGAECVEEDDGVLADECPSGEKAVCIDEDTENMLIKLYSNAFTCGDFGLKNINGAETSSPKGWACGPIEIEEEGVQVQYCMEFPTLGTNVIKLSCEDISVPFLSECQSGFSLKCHDPQSKTLVYFYSEDFSSVPCSVLGLENP